MDPKRYFSATEWEVLEYVSRHHPSTVREVTEQFAASRGYARTTVLTIMERLRAKGYLTRRKESGVDRYAPSEPRPRLLSGLVRDFVENALGGSVAPFVAYLGKEARLSRAEVEELRRIVEQMDPDGVAEDATGDEPRPGHRPASGEELP